MNTYTDRWKEQNFQAFLTLVETWGINKVKVPQPAPNEGNEKAALKQYQSIAEKSFYHHTKLALQCYRDLAAVCRVKKLQFGGKAENINWKHLARNFQFDESVSDDERQVFSLEKTEELLRYMETSLELLRKTRPNGVLYHSLLHYTYFSKREYKVTEIFEKIQLKARTRGISQTSYYRNMPKAIELYSIFLWSSPNTDLNVWFDFLCLAQAAQEDRSFEPITPEVVVYD